MSHPLDELEAWTDVVTAAAKFDPPRDPEHDLRRVAGTVASSITVTCAAADIFMCCPGTSYEEILQATLGFKHSAWDDGADPPEPEIKLRQDYGNALAAAVPLYLAGALGEYVAVSDLSHLIRHFKHVLIANLQAAHGPKLEHETLVYSRDDDLRDLLQLLRVILGHRGHNLVEYMQGEERGCAKAAEHLETESAKLWAARKDTEARHLRDTIAPMVRTFGETFEKERRALYDESVAKIHSARAHLVEHGTLPEDYDG